MVWSELLLASGDHRVQPAQIIRTDSIHCQLSSALQFMGLIIIDSWGEYNYKMRLVPSSLWLVLWKVFWKFDGHLSDMYGTRKMYFTFCCWNYMRRSYNRKWMQKQLCMSFCMMAHWFGLDVLPKSILCFVYQLLLLRCLHFIFSGQ